jgi:hypothetical protein
MRTLISALGRRRPPLGLLKIKIFLTNKDIDRKAKKRFYAALCLSIPPHGSEIGCLREDLLNRLRHLHHQCARTMRSITIAHSISHRISSVCHLKASFQMSKQSEQKEREKIHTVRPAGLKPRRSFSYTIITKSSCF